MKTKSLFFILFAATVLRGVWAWTHEVAPAEAYFWMCSQRLAGAFFDGPAGTALLVSAFGESFDFARLFWPVLAFLSSWSAWIFIHRIYDDATAMWVVLLLNSLPAFNLAAVEIGPLMPALLSAMTGLIFARMAWEGRQWAWAAAGLFFGVGLAFRYEVGLVPLGLLVAALAVRRHRTNIPALAVMVLLCGLALWPSVAWNASLEWVPIAGWTWKSAIQFRLDPFTASLSGFFQAFSIPVGLALFAGLFFLVRSSRRHARAGFLLGACGLVWAWGLYLLIHGGQAVTAGWLGFVPLAGFVAAAAQKRPDGRAAWSIAVGLSLLTGALSLFGPHGASWKSVAEELHAAAKDLPAADQSGFFIAEDPEMAAVLGYYIRTDGGYPSVFVPESPDFSHQFGFWPSYADFVEGTGVADQYFTEQKGENPFLGRNAIFIGGELPQTIRGAFSNVLPLRTIPGPHGKNLLIYVCLGYQTLPL